MSAGHLSCTRCRLRVLADAPAIGLLEAHCPICGDALTPAPAESLLGFRFFDLDPLSEHGPRQFRGSLAPPAELLPRHDAGCDNLDTPQPFGLS